MKILKTINFIVISWMLMVLVNTAFNIRSAHKPMETAQARAFLFTFAFITPIIIIDNARDKRIQKKRDEEATDKLVKAIMKMKRIQADPDAYYFSQEFKDDMDESIEKWDKQENRQMMAEHFPELAEKFGIKPPRKIKKDDI
jgi:hypothetical protein